MSSLKRFINSESFQRSVAVVFSITLIIVNIIRIFSVSITHDETGYRAADSYIDLMQDKFASANNHILHSLFRKFFVETFSDSLFFLRVDSLCAQVLFIYFSYRLCRFLFKNNWWHLLAFITLNIVSPLVFDFWGLSRGYGLALSFMTVSIYYLVRYIDDCRVKTLSFCLGAACLCVYSNFSFINYYVSLSATIVGYSIFLKEKNSGGISFFKELMVLFLFSAILGLMIIMPLTYVYGNGELFYMGNNGFIPDTITSLVREGLSLSAIVDPGLIDFLIKAVIVITWAAGIYWLYFYWRTIKRKEIFDMETKFGVVLYLLLIIPFVSVKVQHKFFHINYIRDRAALFFILLFILHFLYWLYNWRLKIPVAGAVLSIITFIALTYNFCIKERLYVTRLWWYDSEDMAVLKKMVSEQGNEHRKINVFVNWMHAPSFKYNIEHRYNGHFNTIPLHHLDPDKDTSYDYYYIPTTDIPLIDPKYKRDTQFEGGGFILFKK